MHLLYCRVLNVDSRRPDSPSSGLFRSPCLFSRISTLNIVFLPKRIKHFRKKKNSIGCQVCGEGDPLHLSPSIAAAFELPPYSPWLGTIFQGEFKTQHKSWPKPFPLRQNINISMNILEEVFGKCCGEIQKKISYLEEHPRKNIKKKQIYLGKYCIIRYIQKKRILR